MLFAESNYILALTSLTKKLWRMENITVSLNRTILSGHVSESWPAHLGHIMQRNILTREILHQITYLKPGKNFTNQPTKLIRTYVKSPGTNPTQNWLTRATAKRLWVHKQNCSIWSDNVFLLFMVILGKIVRLSFTIKITWALSKNCSRKAVQLNPWSTREPQVTLYHATKGIKAYNERKSCEFFSLWQTEGEKEQSLQTKQRWPELDNITELENSLLFDEHLDDEVPKTDKCAEHDILLRRRLWNSSSGLIAKINLKRPERQPFILRILYRQKLLERNCRTKRFTSKFLSQLRKMNQPSRAMNSH